MDSSCKISVNILGRKEAWFSITVAAEEIVSGLALKVLSYNLATPDEFTIHNPIQITNCDMHKLEKPNHEDSMVSEVI